MIDLFSCFGSTLTMSMDVCIYRCYFTEDIGFITGMSKGWHGAQLWDIGMFFFFGFVFSGPSSYNDTQEIRDVQSLCSKVIG